MEKVIVKRPNFIDPQFILYDIETLPFDFTNAVYIAKQKRFVVYVNSRSKVDQDSIREIALRRFKGLVNDVVFVTDPSRYRDMRKWLLFDYDKDGLIRAGWNSKRFDIPVLFSLMNGLAPDARYLANQLIVDKRRPYQLYMSDGQRIGKQYQLLKAINANEHHIDISLLNEKSSDVDGKERTPASLKMISAYAGLEVLDDDVTRIDFDTWTNGTWYDLPDERQAYLTMFGELTDFGFNKLVGMARSEYIPDVYDKLPKDVKTLVNSNGSLNDAGLKYIAGVTYRDWDSGSWSKLDDRLKTIINPDSSLTTKGLTEMITYNMQDVLNTGLIFEMPEYKTSYHTKKALIEKFGINAKQAVASPSDTSAQLSALVLTEGDNTRFRDKLSVDFKFPMPTGETIDLLEYLTDLKIIPPVLHDFYGLLRGRDAKSHDEMNAFLKDADELFSSDNYSINGTPVRPAFPHDHKTTHTNATLSVPYFDKNLNPIQSYNTFSRGGSHGVTSKNACNFTFQNARMVKISAKKRAKDKAIICTVYDNDVQKKTMDCSAWAIDVDSFYPSFLVLLGVYVMADGTDVYDEIRRERLKLKASLPKNRSDYTAEDEAHNREQLGSKLILNSVSGASNMMSDYSLLQLDNAIMSMRLMGNLFIYMIATYFVRELGAEVLSTNTDGIEITFDHLPESERPSAETIEALSLLLTHEYGFGLEPEFLDRFVVKDSNNRIEWHGKVINKSAGKLNKGFNKTYARVDSQGRIDNKPSRIGLDSKLDHPMVTDMAVLAYIDAHPDYLNPEYKYVEAKPETTRNLAVEETPEVIEWLSNWISEYANGNFYELKFNIFDWLVFTKGTRARLFYGDGEKLQDNNRYVFTKQGVKITSTLSDKPTKITGWTSNTVKILNTIDSLNEVEPDMIDFEPYIRWAYNTLSVWVNDEQTKAPRKPKPKKAKAKTTTRKTHAKKQATDGLEQPVSAVKIVDDTNTPDEAEALTERVDAVLADVDLSDETSILARFLSHQQKEKI